MCSFALDAPQGRQKNILYRFANCSSGNSFVSVMAMARNMFECATQISEIDSVRIGYHSYNFLGQNLKKKVHMTRSKKILSKYNKISATKLINDLFCEALCEGHRQTNTIHRQCCTRLSIYRSQYSSNRRTHTTIIPYNRNGFHSCFRLFNQTIKTSQDTSNYLKIRSVYDGHRSADTTNFSGDL